MLFYLRYKMLCFIFASTKQTDTAKVSHNFGIVNRKYM